MMKREHVALPCHIYIYICMYIYIYIYIYYIICMHIDVECVLSGMISAYPHHLARIYVHVDPQCYVDPHRVLWGRGSDYWRLWTDQ